MIQCIRPPTVLLLALTWVLATVSMAEAVQSPGPQNSGGLGLTGDSIQAISGTVDGSIIVDTGAHVLPVVSASEPDSSSSVDLQEEGDSDESFWDGWLENIRQLRSVNVIVLVGSLLVLVLLIISGWLLRSVLVTNRHRSKKTYETTTTASEVSTSRSQRDEDVRVEKPSQDPSGDSVSRESKVRVPVQQEGTRLNSSDHGTGPGWRYVAAKAVGKSHVKSETQCQDAYACVINDEGWLVIAVADGAGSAKLSHIGSEAAVEAAVKSLARCRVNTCEDLLPVLREAYTVSRERVFAEAKSRSLDARDLASTLLLFVAGPGGSGAAHVGDGVIATCQEGRQWNWVFWPAHGEYVNTTQFLTDDDALETVRFSCSSEIPQEIAVMTDGLEHAALDLKNASVHLPFFEPLMGQVKPAQSDLQLEKVARELGEWIGSEGVGSRTDDDITLVLALSGRAS